MAAPNFDEEREKCKAFLELYGEARGDDPSTRKYRQKLRNVANRVSQEVVIDLDDVEQHFFETDEHFASRISGNTMRYVSLFSEAIDSIMPRPTVPFDSMDVADVLREQRMQHQTADATAGPDAGGELPAELTRRYEVRFSPLTSAKKAGVLSVRDIKSAHIGSLVTVKGIVVRASSVKPQMKVATYTCDTCPSEIYQEVTGKSFSPLTICESAICKANRAKGKLLLQTRGSKFVKFQEVKIQELADQVPMGHIPRSMTLHLHGELTRKVSPGDMVTVSGVFLPTPYTGFRGMRAGLIADTYLEAMEVRQQKKRYNEFSVSDDLLERMQRMGERAYEMLARSIAPEIYGHEDVKKALLLLLVGGVTRLMKDGMKIRGDLHCCLMGDPGVAKSQLLKYIGGVAPRGVYTTGKGSSGVGLTAAVLRDQFTQELVLEGGALVLADLGVCCIDEFDKMDDADRTAIHEVMEQQSVSIAKAGITTTLNARTSVLAAANPIDGKYNLRKSPAANINMPAALLSRFDLLFLILDKANFQNDSALARHVTSVHMHHKAPELDFEPISPAQMRSFIAAAKQKMPFVPRELTEQIVGSYVELRQKEAQMSEDETHSYTTARTLLSILRMAQALARLRLSDVVVENDIKEAMRLIDVSKSSLMTESTDRRREEDDPTIVIYHALVEYRRRHGTPNTLSLTDVVYPVAQRAGFTNEQADACLDTFQNDVDVWVVDRNAGTLTFVH